MYSDINFSVLLNFGYKLYKRIIGYRRNAAKDVVSAKNLKVPKEKVTYRLCIHRNEKSKAMRKRE